MSFTSVLPVNPTILNCPNPNDGSITIVAIQAVSYSKDNGVTWQASAIFPNLTAGSYRLKIKNILNCEIAYVGNPVVLTAPTCLEICGDNIDNDGDGLKDCFDSDCGVLNIPSVLSTNPTLFNCPNPNDGTITVATLGVGYEYSKNNGSTWQASPIFTGLTEGSYNIKARNTITGCEVSYASNPVVLTKPLCIEICGDNIDNDGDGNADCADSDCGFGVPTVVSTNPTFLNCPYPNDGTITVTTLGAGYEYSKDNGSTWQPLNAFIGLSVGSYNIKIRNIATNCEIAYAANPVILINPLCIEMCTDNIDNDGDGKIDCDDSDCAALTIPAVVATSPVLVPNDGVILITNLGLGYEYSIDSGMTWQSLNLFSNLTGGTYHARVRNTISGCISDFKDNPIILTLLIPIEICVDGIDNDGDGKIDCADSDCGILNFSSVLSTNPTLLNCPNPNDGTITVLSLGILYEYSIDNGATWQVNPIFTGLTEGSYNVKARSTLTNCTITYPSNPVVLTKFCIEICIDGIDNDGDGAVDCFDSDCINTTNATLSADKMAVCSTGSIATITAMGGGTYKWNTGDSTAVIQTMTAGLYIVTVTNGIGCTNITQIYIDSTYAKATKAYISPGLGTTLLGFNGASYLWSTADTTRSIYMTQAGTYTVTITGVDGCTEIRNIVITEKLPFEVSCDEMPLYNISAGTVLQGAQTLSWESLDGVPIVGHSALDTVITVDLSRTKPDSIYKFLRIIDLAGVKDSDCYQLHVMDCNTKPILTSGILIVNEDTPDSLCLNFVDPDANQNHIATLCNTPAHGTVTTSVQAGQVCITYTPDANYHGLDTICLVLCDDDIRGAKCDSVLIPVIINSINDAPTLTDTLHEVVKTAIPKIICTTITDVDLLDNRRVSTVCSAQHGRAIPSVIGDQLCLTYVSRLRYVGADTVCLKVCDNSGDCDTIIYVIDVVKNCVSMDLKVMLEGPYDPATGKMRTTLNQRGLLPGQTPVGVFSIPTPIGHPFSGAPWNFTEPEELSVYPSNAVDWVLVSLRVDSISTDNVFQAAALLLDDGTVQFTNPCYNIPIGAYFLVIEHRNHIGVMSPVEIPVVGGILTFDFTKLNSFVVNNPPSFGQKLKGSQWLMLAGDGKKDTRANNFDINFNDAQLWRLKTGQFDAYHLSDFNMDGDINFKDAMLMKANNGKFSGIAH